MFRCITLHWAALCCITLHCITLHIVLSYGVGIVLCCIAMCSVFSVCIACFVLCLCCSYMYSLCPVRKLAYKLLNNLEHQMVVKECAINPIHRPKLTSLFLRILIYIKTVKKYYQIGLPLIHRKLNSMCCFWNKGILLLKRVHLHISVLLSRYEYKMAREYNWNVKNKATKGYEASSNTSPPISPTPTPSEWRKGEWTVKRKRYDYNN